LASSNGETSGIAYFGDDAPNRTVDRQFLGPSMKEEIREGSGSLSVDPGAISVSTPQGERPFAAVVGAEFKELASAAEPYWNPGDIIDVKITGDPLSSFSSSITLPGAVTLTLPRMDAPIDRIHDLVVPFTASGTEPVWLWLIEFFAPSAAGPDRIAVSCHSRPGETTVVVPHEFLRAFQENNGDVSGGAPLAIAGGRSVDHVTRVGDRDVLLEATISQKQFYDVTP